MSLASNAQYYRDVATLLGKWGWSESIDFYTGWSTRTNGSTIRTPSAVTVHHTGGKATATSYLVNPIDRPQLKVLANIHVTHGHRIKFIAAGSTSHGGYTHQPCYDRIVAGTAPLDRDLVPGADSSTFSINTRTVGIEVDGAGGSAEWDEWTRAAVLALCAACNIVGGWMKAGGHARVGAHKEHTRRKPGDPFMSMGELRARTNAAVSAGKVPPPGTPPVEIPPALGVRVLSKNGVDRGADVVQLIDVLNARGYLLKQDGMFGPSVEAAVKDFQAKSDLPATGVVDPFTAAYLLNEKLPEPQPEEPEPIPTPEPEPDPEPQPNLKFRFGQANLHAERFQGPDDDTEARANFLSGHMKCSLYALAEVSEKARDYIRDNLAGGRDRWRVYPVGYVAALWDLTKWVHVGKEIVTFDRREVHGAVRAELIHKETGRKVDLIALHIRPAIAIGGSKAHILAEKKADIRKALGLVRKGIPTIFAGDFNTAYAGEVVLAAGLVRATPAVDTSDKAGVQKLDAVFVTPDLKVTGTKLVNPGGISDHQTWVVDLDLPPLP